MGIALLRFSTKNTKPLADIQRLCHDVLHLELIEYVFVDAICIERSTAKKVSLQDVMSKTRVYMFEPGFPVSLRKEIEEYFVIHGHKNLFGRVADVCHTSHFLRAPLCTLVHDGVTDLEQVLAQMWTKLLHPVIVKTENGTPAQARSIHDIRHLVLPRLLSGEVVECASEPKGQKMTCVVARNIRGKNIYSSPLFDKRSDGRIFASSLPHDQKRDILEKAEHMLLSQSHSFGLVLDFVYTSKGTFLLTATPLDTHHVHNVPSPFSSVGVSAVDILKGSLAFSS